MSRAIVESRRTAIRKHLFLLCPNNSGSTYLGNAIAKSNAVWSMPHEGQHMFGFAGPNTRNSPWALIWGGSEESIAHFADANAYDWDRTRLAWYFHATAARDDAPVFFTKSPPFLLIASELERHFANVSFIFMLRDPYAALEGILRRQNGDIYLEGIAELPKVAARHLITCFKRQRANIERHADRSVFFTYEELCADPAGIAADIETLVPELSDLDLSQRLAVKGLYDEKLRNMNDEQISRLTSAEIAAANEVFADHAGLLGYFGYTLRDPAEGLAHNASGAA